MRATRRDPAYRGMATTLTLYLGMWPCAYLLQVGDGRCSEVDQLLRHGLVAGHLGQLTLLRNV